MNTIQTIANQGVFNSGVMKGRRYKIVANQYEFVPEIWDMIKEYNDWTKERREVREQYALICLDSREYKNIEGNVRTDRIAPAVKIGDEICDGEKLCGRVIKINKASLDIERYAYIGYSVAIRKEITPTNQIISSTVIHKWKRDFTTKLRWIGSYQVGDNKGGFKKMTSEFALPLTSNFRYSQERYVVGVKTTTHLAK